VDKTNIATGTYAVFMGAPIKTVINARGKQEDAKGNPKYLGADLECYRSFC
jgi:hypothetical protein